MAQARKSAKLCLVRLGWPHDRLRPHPRHDQGRSGVHQGREKNRTKTNQDREIELCPRALEVLRRQLALREKFVAAGKINHPFVLFWHDGSRIRSYFPPYELWRKVMKALPAVSYHPPYNRRHSFISRRLMIGHNRLLVAQEDGHSVTTMEETYAAWINGTKSDDLEKIRAALAAGPANV